MVSASCNTCLNQVICTRANAQRFVKLQHSPQVSVRRVGRSDLQHTITMSRQRFRASPISNSWIKPQRTRQLNVTRPRNRNFNISGSEFASRFAHSRGLDTHTQMTVLQELCSVSVSLRGLQYKYTVWRVRERHTFAQVICACIKTCKYMCTDSQNNTLTIHKTQDTIYKTQDTMYKTLTI